MPDLASQIEDSFLDDDALEPDENTLITALRNQDDIPILMDVVKDKVLAELACEDEASFSLSREELDEGFVEEGLSSYDELPVVESESQSYVAQESAEPSHGISNELISQAIAQVLEKRLPDLVKEVIDVVSDLAQSQK